MVMAAPSYRPGYNRTSGYYGRFSGPNAELKFLDTALSFNVDTTGEVPATGQLALIPQGDTESSRDGRACCIKSVYIKMNMSAFPTTEVQTAPIITIYLIQDTQTNGAAAAVTDVFTSATVPTAMVNLANSQRFKILKKFVYTFNTGAGVSAAYNATAKHIDYYTKCNIPMQFDNTSTTGAITTIRTNNLFLIAGAAGTGADDIVNVTGTCRIRFSDKT